MQKKKKEKKISVNVLVTENELKRIVLAASTLEIKSKAGAIRALALLKAKEIIPQDIWGK